MTRNPAKPNSLLMIATLCVVNFVAVAQEGNKGDDKDHGQKGGREFWGALSEKQREKLRTALREVWTDPGVISAREEVKRASDSYQKAVREAVSKTDPEVADLIVKSQAGNDRSGHDHRGGPPPIRFNQRRSGNYPIGPPGFLEKLSPENREHFLEIQKKAEESEAVIEARENLESLRKKDDAIRIQQMRAHVRLRKAILDKMIEMDPELEKYRETLEFSRKGRPPGKPGDKDRPEGGDEPPPGPPAGPAPN